MPLTKLRQQGGAVVVTIPGEIASAMGWSAGTTLIVTADGNTVSMTPAKRVARGRRSVTEILDGIDEQEISRFNDDMRDDLSDAPQGKEKI
ncbi:AbrB/MazE/SpoVT family DNA-binding domain-containing protein [Citrobacter rodentium]|uniref:Plasmid-related protein n=2 Tax=Citrobacter rodentium TaxID=67825 RepID=D2TLD9_CITRI|nr:antitoxin [Citrobacter rodentium]KIQ48891.1 antitoxin [Citrobacter rodentium]QBY29523.1 antitoxin [Citrobacter rodentium]UHO33082.1 antitoxin [Citrobacter rodentium NBRC 105723 = DSM 16636]CBG89824.1 putative plasmid-related protein [Citrobacter rodentium ICC168]HAT8012565.1 antitoxin [Citrobacter rodentium NBRC 105723 = DSM 16636]